jgi:hypothetical protein
VKAKKTIIPLRPMATTPAHAVRDTSFYNPTRDGVTFSLLSTFLTCREKARLFLKGYSGAYSSFAQVFGTVVHRVLQRAYHEFHTRQIKRVPDAAYVNRVLDDLQRVWVQENLSPHPKAVEVFEEVLAKASALLPSYFVYWAKDDFSIKRWLEIEEIFRLPWTVTTRKGVKLSTFLRGRIDAAYVLPASKFPTAPRLLETKTRTHVDESNLVDVMPHDRQPSTYLSALRKKTGKTPKTVLMNIIKKPQLRQKQKESWSQFAKRIETDVKSRPDFYFLRMEMSVDPQDINRSEEELNDLISDFLLWWAGESGHYKNSDACVTVFGRCPYLGVCSRNDYHGLVKRDVVFRELEGE